MSDEQKNAADLEEQDNETVNTTDELTDEELDQVAAGARESGSGMATGRRQYEPMRLSKIDK